MATSARKKAAPAATASKPGANGQPQPSRKSKQERRNIASVEAYTAKTKVLFDLAIARMELAATILRQVRETYPEVDPHIVPTTTSFDRSMKQIEARSKEFLKKAEQKRDSVVRQKTKAKKKLGRPRTKPET